MTRVLMQAPVSVRQLLREASKSLGDSGSAQLDAELLLAACINRERAHLYAFPEAQVPAGAISRFRLMLARRQERCPLAYLTGHREFWSMDLRVSEDTLVPRPETECLVEWVLDLCPARGNVDILELGTGSGAIALALARELPRSRVLATDLSSAALAMANANARELQVDNVSFRVSDWFSAVPDRRFDFIVSNPPYVASADQSLADGELRHEPRLALDGGPQGLDALRLIVRGARGYLGEGACLVLEHGHQQGAAVRADLATNGYHGIETRRDLAGLERVSLGRRQG